MKNLLKFIIVLLIGLSTMSCSDFLNTQPEDFSTPTNTLTTATGFENGVWGIYSVLGTLYSDNYINFISGATDECYANFIPAISDIRVLIHNSSSSAVSSVWNTLYSGILRANTVLEAAKNKPNGMSDVDFQYYKAEARFLRGYFYYLLVANWGDVPLITNMITDPNMVSRSRTPKEIVYAQVLEDMTYAADSITGAMNIKSFPSTGGAGRISRQAVWGCLARVCLQMAGEPLKDVAKFNDAKLWSNKVYTYYTAKGLNLCTDYTKIFKDLASDKYNMGESMWEVEFVGDGQGSKDRMGSIGVNYGILSSDQKTVGKGYAYYSVNFKLTKTSGLYEAKDVRQSWNTANFYYNTTSSTPQNYPTWLTNYPGKFRRQYEPAYDKTYAQYASTINFPVLRYADVLLMLAEAENELNGPTALAYDALNKVRARAGATPFAGGDKTSFRKFIQDERLRELCFESLRRLDLIRWGIYISSVQSACDQNVNHMAEANSTLTILEAPQLSYLKNNIQLKHLLLPIPLAEMNANSLMTQNIGY